MGRKTGMRVHAAATGIVAAVLLLTACSDGDTKDKADDGDGKSKGLQWASCMRDAGVQVEDPKPDQPLGLIPQGTDQAKADAAFKKCQKFFPDGNRATDANKKKWAAQGRDYAKCMRDNGVANMPDPDENGTLEFPQDGTQDTQRFKDADAKCHSKLNSERMDVPK